MGDRVLELSPYPRLSMYSSLFGICYGALLGTCTTQTGVHRNYRQCLGLLARGSITFNVLDSYGCSNSLPSVWTMCLLYGARFRCAGYKGCWIQRPYSLLETQGGFLKVGITLVQGGAPCLQTRRGSPNKY